MQKKPIISAKAPGFVWETSDPFLFCVHHLDDFPKGNQELGPAASLAGRDLGQDFTPIDGWRMYHGESVPGFPAHPHRGFETVTVVLDGFVDHSDSHGAAGRYGNGDVQWMTAGSGLQAAGMNIPDYHSMELMPDYDLPLQAGSTPARLPMLQGRPIAEPVAQYGPFVMNTQQELRQVFEDYQRTQFGGWPWQRSDPLHGPTTGRFARYSNGSQEIK